MIKQIVVEQDQGKPDQVGVLMTNGDIGEIELAQLGSKLARLDLRLPGNFRGIFGGVGWCWVPMHGETPGLEYQTIRVPRRPTYQEIVELEQMMRADGVTDDPAVCASLPADPVVAGIAACVGVEPGKLQREMEAMNYGGGPSGPLPHHCDRVPAWLWPLVTAVVGGLIIAGVR